MTSDQLSHTAVTSVPLFQHSLHYGMLLSLSSPAQLTSSSHNSIAMGAMDESLARLRRPLCQEARVSPDVCSFVIDNLKSESVSDFAGLFDSSTYQEGVKTQIIALVASADKDLIQLSRCRTAWEMARADLS